MLGIEDFSKQIEDRLNTIASGITGAIPFKIYTNVGDYMQAYRVINDIEQYQFGIMRVLPSEIVPIKGLSVQNLVIQIEFGVEIDKSEKDEYGNYIQALNTQLVLNNFAQGITGTTETIKGTDDKNYTVAYSVNPCTVGNITMTSSDKGEILPIQITIEVGAVENGINLNDVDLYIDGEQIYPLSVTATRKRIPQENAFSNKTSTSIGILQNGFGLDLAMPLLYNPIGEKILDDIYIGKDNVAHCVKLDMDKYITYYSGTITNPNTENEYIANFKKNFSLFNYDTQNKQLEFYVTIKSDLTIHTPLLPPTLPSTFRINYGDNTSDTTTTTHTYAEAGVYKITLKKGIELSNILRKSYCYIMTLGNTNHNTAINSNIIPSISLIEGVLHVLEYNDNWVSISFTYDVETTVDLGLLIPDNIAVNVGDIIFTGDNNCFYTTTKAKRKYYVEPIGIWHTYKPGTYTLRIYHI